jgi:hypothetical protein
MKYRLIDKTTGIETLCDKVTIDGFDYYFSNQLPKVGDTVYNCKSKEIYKITIKEEVVNYEFPIICCNNPNIDIPKAVTDCMLIEKLANTLTSHLTFPEERREGIIFGYNKSQATHPFSEENMIDFAEFYFREEFNSTMQDYKPSKEILRLWKEQQPKIVYYE